ncbi:nucleotide disphospho-sugar-binding domain-containing protein [Amycolatopsis panacis]|nr:nucleotide disphospho-sugar-binding domain-containing protein [Amycolatopsis panacis]
MRVLFLTSSAVGHVFPFIPTAWALRSAGHEVLFGGIGDAVDAVARAGLHAVDLAPDANVGAVVGAYTAQSGLDWNSAQMADREFIVDYAAELFAKISDIGVDGGVRLAETWRPDLVVHGHLQGVGPLVGQKVSVPAVEHGIDFGSQPLLTERLHQYMADSYQRHGLTGPLRRDAVINVAPPSIAFDSSFGWFVRYVPYNTGGSMPEWLLAKPERPLVGVTLGTTVPQLSGVGGLRGLVEAAAEVDADFVLALGKADPAELGALPDNVRAAGWVPLNALLANCAALVHHAGSGATMGALTAGVPQLVLPHGLNQFYNASVVAERGVGLAPEVSSLDSAVIQELVSSTELRKAASEVRAEIAALPSPAAMVDRLVALAG